MLDHVGKGQLVGSQVFDDCRMGRVEGDEPVAQGLEEGECLQVGKGGDKHIASLNLHFIELFNLAGNAALVQPILPLGIGLDITQVDNL